MLVYWEVMKIKKIQNNGKKSITNREKSGIRQDIYNEKKRYDARRFFLTISKVDEAKEITREKLRDLLVEKEESLSHYMIGEELHVDRTKHYHIYLKYSRKRCFGHQHFDYLGKHPKIETCRSSIGSYMYISKEDRTPLSNFDYEAGILKGRTEEIAQYLSQIGKTYEELFVEDKKSIHAIATKWRGIKAWEQEYLEMRRMVEITKKKKGIRLIDDELMQEVLSSEERDLIASGEPLKAIIRHINQMIEHRWNKPFKMKNILIWSRKVGIGKTSLIHKIAEYCPIFSFPRDKWFHGYKSKKFWGILWNEMDLKGVDINMLKNFLEGTPIKLDVKGSSIAKDDNPEVFMTANESLEQMIREKYRFYIDEEKISVILDALRERIEEVCVDNYEDIFFFSKLIVSVSGE